MKINNKLMKPIVSSCTYDTTLFNTPHINKLVRSGNVVEITFIAQMKATPSGNTNIITGLPTIAKGVDVPILAFVGSSRYIPDSATIHKQLWTYVNGSIRTGPADFTANKWLYFNFVYITSDTN